MSSNGVIPVICESIHRRRAIRIEDVRALRKFVYSDALISRDEADAVFELAAANYPDCPEWRELFAETMSDWLVAQNEPEGFVSEEKADWLVSRIGRAGRVTSLAEFDLLAMTMEKARATTPGLIRFALSQMRAAVRSGASPLRAAKTAPGSIDPAEIAMLRRIIFAASGDNGASVTRDEAEMLFDINDALTASNPEWDDLFVKAVVNCVMAASFAAPPDRAEALSRRAWLDSEARVDVGGFLSRMLGGAALAMRDDAPDAFTRMNARLDGEIAANAAISHDEAAWLAGRIGRAGRLTDNARKILRFIAKESPKIDPSLQPLIDLAA